MAKTRTCRECGCIQTNACVSDGVPCHWVEPDLCSACAPPRRTPKQLTSAQDRRMARHMRDRQWAFAARVAAHGTLWLCWWNKNRHHDRTKPLPDDLEVCGLIDGLELLEWLGAHKDWWSIGEWSHQRYAAPVSLTEAGRLALAERGKYDMDWVTGGLVEPGWKCRPAAPS